METNSVVSASTIGRVVQIHRSGIFTIDEARALLPIVYKVTKSYALEVDELRERIKSLGNGNSNLVHKLEEQIYNLVNDWNSKVQRLGVLPKGMWIGDFDSGDGYFCWKYPERSLEYWHKYEDGYTKRIKLNADSPSSN